MMRSRVDLPEPDLPSRATISPSASRKSTWSSTFRGAPSAVRNDFATSLSSSSVSAIFRRPLVVALFAHEVQAPPEQSVEGHHVQAHHAHTEGDAMEVARVGRLLDVASEARG